MEGEEVHQVAVRKAALNLWTALKWLQMKYM